MEYLLLRFGGIGDSMILTVVAKELVRRGHSVTYAVMEPHVPLFDNLKCFKKVLPMRRIHTYDCVPHPKWGWVATDWLKDAFQQGVVEYKFSIERNSLYAALQPMYGEWIAHQNSNYQNWIDVMLSWANIDPTTVEDKQPLYKIKKTEKDWAKSVLPSHIKRPVIAMQMQASSMARTWYHAEQLPRKFIDIWPHVSILIYDGEKWELLRKDGRKTITLPHHPVRHSAALLSLCDGFIACDTGLVQIADALNVKTIACYTTVPAWTRIAYSRNVTAIESLPLPCRPCFTLDRFCPERRKQALESLSDREKKMREFQEQGMDLNIASFELNTTPQLLDGEFLAMNHRLENLSGLTPMCVETITIERILQTAERVFTFLGKKD